MWDQSEQREAVLRQARERRPTARDALQAYLGAHPDDDEVLKAFVETRVRSGAPLPEVEELLDRLCELRPSDPDPFRVRFGVRFRLARPADALADGIRGLELAPDDHEFRRAVVGVAVELGRADIALPELTRLLESSPFPKPEVGAMLARARWEAGDTAGAVAALEQYVPRDEDYPPARTLRGIVLHAAGRHAEAIPLLRAAADAVPADREVALFHLANAQTALKRDAEAQATLAERAAGIARGRIVAEARNRPDDLPAQVAAADALLAEGRPREAALVLESAVVRHGEHPSIRRPMAEAYRRLGRVDLADLWSASRK